MFLAFHFCLIYDKILLLMHFPKLSLYKLKELLACICLCYVKLFYFAFFFVYYTRAIRKFCANFFSICYVPCIKWEIMRRNYVFKEWNRFSVKLIFRRKISKLTEKKKKRCLPCLMINYFVSFSDTQWLINHYFRLSLYGSFSFST